jgi:pyruvate dehydrogenase E1 component alpha subunit
MAAVTVDGNDPIAMYAAAKDAVERARTGGGPSLIEANTYRFFGHMMGDKMHYMPKEELEAAIAADPVPRYREWLLKGGHLTEAELAGIEADCAAEIDDAVAYALACPPPPPEELFLDVYAEAASA